jgi:hypothetical protein
MVQPFEQQDGNQGCSNLDAQSVLTGADEAFYLKVLLGLSRSIQKYVDLGDRSGLYLFGR